MTSFSLLQEKQVDILNIFIFYTNSKPQNRQFQKKHPIRFSLRVMVLANDLSFKCVDCDFGHWFVKTSI